MNKLGFGLMRLPALDKNGSASVDVEKVKQMVDAFIEAGVCTLRSLICSHSKTADNLSSVQNTHHTVVLMNIMNYCMMGDILLTELQPVLS